MQSSTLSPISDDRIRETQRTLSQDGSSSILANNTNSMNSSTDLLQSNTTNRRVGDISAVALDTTQTWKTSSVIWTALRGSFAGIVDSLNIFTFLGYCVRNNHLFSILVKCTLINCILYLSLLTIGHMMSSLKPSGVFALVWESIFNVLWVVPMYIISQLLGLTWYDELYRLTQEEKKKCSKTKNSLPLRRDVSFTSLSEMILKCVVTLLFAVIAGIVAVVVPICGTWIAFFMGSLLHAFYCFDYRFLDQGEVNRGKLTPLSYSRMIALFEAKWPYYFGYGSTHLAFRGVLEASGTIPWFGRLALCSALFAVNVVTTVDARPMGTMPVELRLPLFSFLNGKIATWWLRYMKEKGDEKK